MRHLAFVLAASLAPLSATAHPGHGIDPIHGLGHALGDPFHIGTALLAVCVALGLLGALRSGLRARARRR